MEDVPRQPRMRAEIHAGARINAAIHRRLLQQLIGEDRTFKEWLEEQEQKYLEERQAEDTAI